MHFLDDGRRGLGAFLRLLQLLDLFGGVDTFGIDARQPQGPFHRYFPVAERLVGEDLGLLGLFKVQEDVADSLNVLVGKLAILAPEVLAQGPVPLGGVDKLHLALTVLGLRLLSTQI